MNEMINEMFKNYKVMITNLKKKSYEQRFQSFYDNYSETLKEMMTCKNEDKEASFQKTAENFCNAVTDAYGRNGKISQKEQIDLSLFMIYFVLSSIIKIGDADSVLFADTLRNQWRVISGNEAFDYSDYEEIYSNFNDKIFGIF